MDRILEFSGNHPILVISLIAMIVLVVVHEVRRARGGNTRLAAQDAVRLINRGATVVDVRDEAQYAAGHIVNARHLPAAQLKERHGTLAKQKKKPVLTVCDNGSLCARAAAELRELGFEDVYSLAGGINAWRSENLPLVRPEDKPAKSGDGTKSANGKGGGNRKKGGKTTEGAA